MNQERVVVQLAPGDVRSRSITTLSTRLGMPDSSIRPMAHPQRLSIRLANVDQQTQLSALRKQGLVDFVHPCFKSADGKDMGYGDEVIVRWKPEVSETVRQQLLQQLHGSIIRPYAFAADTYVVSAGAANGYDPLALAKKLFESGLCVYAEPDLTLFDGLTNPPNDPLFNYQWTHANTGSAQQYNGTAGIDMKVQQAWTLSTAANIKVAVIDEGIDIDHPDLKDNMVQGFDCVSGTANNGDGKPLSPTRGHGTSCAGIIAARANNNTGIAGVAPDCRLMPINLSAADGSFASYAKIAAGMDYAWQQGADVISNSWGGGAPSGIIEDAINRASTLGRQGKGSIVFFSAGNENGAVYYPAILPAVIAVGGVNMCGQRKAPGSCDGETWWGANYGKGLDLSAPCVKILTTDNSGAGGYNTGDYNFVFNGTSAATPHAAAVAALVLGANRQLTLTQVRNIIETSCDKLPLYNYAMVAGQPNGSWNAETGYGLVNAFRAVQAATTGNYCQVSISANGPLRFCGGGTVTLKVDNPVPGTVYQWRKDGQPLSTGNTLLAASTGNYEVAATAANGCTALSAPLRVYNLSTAPPLIASAGADRLICTGESVQLGGNPTAASGAPWLSNRRVFGMDRRSNSFIKFSPENPLQFDTIAKNILPEDALTANAFFTGGDFTPYGYYVIAPQLNDLYAIDTATGQLQLIGKAVPQQGGSWTGLCWDPSTKNLYATAGTGDNSTLYLIDPFTANARVVATMPVGGLLWLVARHNGDMYTLSSDQYVYSVNKQT
ncbi:MAG TPA: S8 family serine peptidase, partial [Chitinophagaceae bacterium]|nr:S8 family serine peptidase [Chitinophagaceae bacterium]